MQHDRHSTAPIMAVDAWMCLRTASSMSRLRPPRGHARGRQNLSSRCSRVWGQSLRTPSHLHIEEYMTLNSRNCLITSCCKVYCPSALQDCGIRLENFVEPISSRPRLQAKAKARHVRGQGHQNLSSRCPWIRGQSSRTPPMSRC